jgi:hypothetical protein
MTKDQFLNDIPLSAAIAAHSGISFVPEKRGESTRNEYAETMAQDYANLRALIAEHPDMLPTLETEFARYREGYRKRYLAYLHSNSRCISMMITGGSNFPVRRNEKRNNIAHKRLNEFLEFRKRALAAIARELQPWLKPIMAGDADATDRLREKIDEAERLQERMKAINATHKAFMKDPSSLDKSDWPEAVKQEIRTYKPAYSWEPHPYPPFALTNNNANIRRMRQRLEGIERNRATPETQVDGENARLEDCPAENRIRLFFPGKPDEAIRSRLKSAGFRWTPTLGCWQAYRNSNTIQTAQREAGLEQAAA